MVKKNSYGEYIFNDYSEFKPNLSPKEIFWAGAFGGTYWREIYSSVNNKWYKNKHKKYPKSWWVGLPNECLTLPYKEYDKSINLYGVKVGSTLEYWEESGWIEKSHPYGWVQWYCDFFMGKRSYDDERQISRWLKLAGQKGRFRNALINEIKRKKSSYNDYDISPAKRQTLLHWGYQLTLRDFNK
jgi:hypothetical protein